MKCLVWQFHAVKPAFTQTLVREMRLLTRIYSGLRWSDPDFSGSSAERSRPGSEQGPEYLRQGAGVVSAAGLEGQLLRRGQVPV